MKLAAVVVALAPALAWAGDAPPAPPADDEVPPIRPDPRAVSEAREANLEPESQRQGMAIGLAFGPGIQIGFGSLTDASGTGGGFDFRLGTIASPRWVWLVEIAGTLHVKTEGSGETKVKHTDQSALVTGGWQLYLKEAFWLRGGAGLAVYTQKNEPSSPTVMGSEVSYKGVGVIGSGGLDLLRRKSFALSTEVLFTVARYPKADLTVAGGSLQLGFSWY